MTQEEIVEDNLLIAQFMCYWSNLDNSWVFTSPTTGQDIVWSKTVIENSKNNLKYDSNWDWLMPVVKKISNIYDTKGIYIKGLIWNLTIFASLEDTYKSIIEYIKEYNKISVD